MLAGEVGSELESSPKGVYGKELYFETFDCNTNNHWISTMKRKKETLIVHIHFLQRVITSELITKPGSFVKF